MTISLLRLDLGCLAAFLIVAPYDFSFGGSRGENPLERVRRGKIRASRSNCLGVPRCRGDRRSASSVRGPYGDVISWARRLISWEHHPKNRLVAMRVELETTYLSSKNTRLRQFLGATFSSLKR
jgi:hypothetical protein